MCLIGSLLTTNLLYHPWFLSSADLGLVFFFFRWYWARKCFLWWCVSWTAYILRSIFDTKTFIVSSIFFCENWRQESSTTFIGNDQLCQKIHPKSSRDNKAIKRIIEERDWLALEQNTWGSSEQNKRITDIKKLLNFSTHRKQYRFKLKQTNQELEQF